MKLLLMLYCCVWLHSNIKPNHHVRPSSTVFLFGFDVNLIMPSSVIVALAEGWFQFITAWILFFEVLAFISIDNAVLTKVKMAFKQTPRWANLTWKRKQRQTVKMYGLSNCKQVSQCGDWLLSSALTYYTSHSCACTVFLYMFPDLSNISGECSDVIADRQKWRHE